MCTYPTTRYSATMPQSDIVGIEGTALFFGCHAFITETESTLATTLRRLARDQPQCPLCHVKKCLVCDNAFSGWSCETCRSFFIFDGVASDAIAIGANQICFRGGIALIPNPGANLGGITRWTNMLLGATGVVNLSGWWAGGRGTVHMGNYNELQISEMTHPDGTSVSYHEEPLKMKAKTIDADLIDRIENEVQDMESEYQIR
ncbi:hypothetical protein GGR52DRAFT_574884 [Hypoxylon sp. FL1284]|nr:hypothetical protein GGR52DRAFT_574884 [Hypoxylon sp. FL1284]